MFTSTGRILRAISGRKERRMGEDGRRKERHTEWRASGVRDGVTNKEKQSVEHECLQDFAWLERKKGVNMDTWKEAENVRYNIHSIL